MLPTMIVVQFDVVAHNGLILLSPPFAICTYIDTRDTTNSTQNKSRTFLTKILHSEMGGFSKGVIMMLAGMTVVMTTEEGFL